MRKNISIAVIAFLILALLASAAFAAGKSRFDWLVTKRLTVENSADMNGALDMNGNAISNIGDTGTDFDTSGGLTTAAGVTVSAGGIDVTGAYVADVNQEHVGLPSIITATIPYTPATGTVATVATGDTAGPAVQEARVEH